MVSIQIYIFRMLTHIIHKNTETKRDEIVSFFIGGEQG